MKPWLEPGLRTDAHYNDMKLYLVQECQGP